MDDGIGVRIIEKADGGRRPKTIWEISGNIVRDAMNTLSTSLACMLVVGLVCAVVQAEENSPRAFTLWQLPGQTRSQMNSYVIQTAGNEIIVIDGGTKGDADYLRKFIRDRGNHVHAWFISHPHYDHVDALTAILNNLEGMKVDAIYGSLPNDEWLQKHQDSHSLKTQRALLAAVAAAKFKVLPLSLGQKIKFQGATFEILGVCNPELTVNATNNQSSVWRVDIGAKSILFLGDLGVEGGEKLLASPYRGRLKADYVQMAHHGQNGVNEEFYKTVNPKFCLWPTPGWLWNSHKTPEVRAWMKKLNIKKHYIAKDGLHRIDFSNIGRGSTPEQAAAEAAGPGEYLSPVALVASQDGRTLYVAEATARQVAVFDTASGKVTKEIPLADPPAGLVLAPDGSRLYVAGASPEGKVHVIDTQSLKVVESLSVGHTPTALAISPDGKRLYVCNRFSNNVSILDLSAKKEVAKVAVTREPIAAAITPDGKWLVVANHLPFGPASSNYVAAVVSIVAADTGQVAAAVQLLDGATGLRGICVSPDGRFAYVTHILAHYQIPTTQLERGWMNTNAVSVIDLGTKKLVNTVLLDSVDLGAANPWGVACTADGKFLCVAHAGTHEVSVIGLAALHDRLAKVAAGQKVTGVSSSPTDVPSDLAFLVGLRARLKLQGKGPRGLAVIGNRIYAAEYFSDSLGVVDIQPGAQVEAKSIPLGPVRPMTPVRKGEVLFNDAALCFQTWQSCASCHPDARADALNWDLLNDGLGNPKNTKSLLLAHRTPPVMISGIRPSAEVGVRAGIRFIQFAIRPEEDAVAIDEYLKSLTPVSSPHLEKGKRSAAAERGKQVFESAGCASCHPGDLGTDLAKHDVGIGPDRRGIKEFDTPTLVEVWRTAPYLFDGRAATMLEVLTKFNPKDTHGATSKLSKQQIADLAEYVLSR